MIMSDMNTKHSSDSSALWKGILLTAFLLAADQLTKFLAVSTLKGREAFVLIPGLFELLYLENKGAAFGILKNRQYLLGLFAAVVCIGAAVIYRRTPQEKKYTPLRLVCCMLSAGALGNMIDRIFRHYVVDFLYFSLIDFPVFNVADIYVCVSCFLLLFLLLFYYKEDDLKWKK